MTVKPKLSLLDDWRRVARRAWSIRPTNARLCGGLATRRQAEYHQCLGETP